MILEASRGDWWGMNGCPKLRAFCPKPPSLIPAIPGPNREQNPSHFPGQPVLVELPTVGAVQLVLTSPLNTYAWKAKVASGKEHRINI